MASDNDDHDNDFDSRDDDRGSPGPVGGHESYGMDKDEYDDTIGRDVDEADRDKGQKTTAEETSVWGDFQEWVDDQYQAVKDWAFGKDYEGDFSPIGGASSYGMSKKEFDSTIGEQRHEARDLGQRLGRQVDYFAEAPLDYVSDLLENPLVAGITAMTGMGMTAFGIKAVDAVVDLFQGEVDPLGAAANLAASGLTFTPAGAAVPASMRGVAKAALTKGAEEAAVTGAGTIGSKVATATSEGFASALTDNPYGQAVAMAGAGVVGAWGGREVAEAALAESQGKPAAEPTGPSADRSSPLARSGEKAIAASEARRTQDPQVDLYARTVKQLPFYGLTNPQQPYYGV